MDRSPEPQKLECRAARQWLDERRDGELGATDEPRLEAHLADCPDCRAYAAEEEIVAAAFRAAPPLTLPDETLEAVWDRTVRAGSTRRPRAAGWRRWGVPAAAAAGLLMAALAWWPRPAIGPQPPPELSPELARAAADLQLVLALTDRAVQRGEQAAVERVLGGQVAPTLRRLPVVGTVGAVEGEQP